MGIDNGRCNNCGNKLKIKHYRKGMYAIESVKCNKCKGSTKKTSLVS